MEIPRKVWLFAFVYMSLSLLVEASLIIFGGLRVPENNAQIAPVILTVVPVAAAFITGFKSTLTFLTVVILSALLTLFISVAIISTTGLATGFAEPIFTRFTSGFIAALVATNLPFFRKR